MKRFAIVAAVAVLILNGCDLKRVLFWSPDGQRAAVIALDGLHLSDEKGNLSDVIAKNVTLVAWFPDSKRFVAVREEEIKTRAELDALLEDEDRHKLQGFVEKLVTEASNYNGKWDDFRPSFESQVSNGQINAILFLLKERYPQGITGKSGNKWENLAKATAKRVLLQAFTVAGDTATPGEILTRSLEPLVEVRISPTGKAIACVEGLARNNHVSLIRLSLLPAAGGKLRLVASPTSGFPDWTPDGKTVFYATTAQAPAPHLDLTQLGTITSREVCGESGSLLEKFGDPHDSAGILFWPMTKIRCLRDGQIMFAGAEATLPAATADMPQRASLFSIDPSRRSTVARALPRELSAQVSEGLLWGTFEFSPDQKRLLVCSLTTPTPTVITLATGEAKEIEAAAAATRPSSEGDKDTKSALMAEWRTSEEIAVPVPAGANGGSAGRMEYVLWSVPEKPTHCLSCGWPALMDEKKESSPLPPN